MTKRNMVCIIIIFLEKSRKICFIQIKRQLFRKNIKNRGVKNASYPRKTTKDNGKMWMIDDKMVKIISIKLLFDRRTKKCYILSGKG